MVEEEGLDENEDVDELRLLNDDAELSIEELRRRYNFNEPTREVTEAADAGDQPSSSSTRIVVSTTTTTTTIVANKATNDYFADCFHDDEEDDDYVPRPVFYWKKDVRIGDSYQVRIKLFILCRANCSFFLYNLRHDHHFPRHD